MGKTVELEAYGLKDEEELKSKLDLARQAEEATAAKETAETERDASKVELEKERESALRTRALAFFEKNKKRVQPKDREKYMQTWMSLARTGSAEFESGEGDDKVKTKFAPLAIFEASVELMPEVVKMDEEGPENHEDPREGEPETKKGDDSDVVHVELTEKAKERATELQAEAKASGETLDPATAFRQAVLELSKGAEVEE